MSRSIDLKRSRQADAIVEATIGALRKHGYAATSLQRVAEEAHVSKRMLLHYFPSRQALFEAAVRRLCRRILEQVEIAAASTRPADALQEGLALLWDEIIDDPGLHGVFFGLIAESVTDPSLRPTITAVREEYRELIARQLIAARGPDDPLSPERAAGLSTLILGTFVGLTVDYLERGDSPALQCALAEFRRFVAATVAPAPSPPTPAK
jgi:AcrR family transcriptional regulator